MPTYEYACTSCGEHLEVVQSFRDDALSVCPACGGPLRKVFGSIGVVFKGSGFYKTDSRPGTRSSSSSGSEGGASTATSGDGAATSAKGDGQGKSESKGSGSDSKSAGSGDGSAKGGSGKGGSDKSASKPSAAAS